MSEASIDRPQYSPRNLVMVFALIMVVVGVVNYFLMLKSQEELIEHDALKIAAMATDQANASRRVYDAIVAAKPDLDGLEGHAAAAKDKEISPLPSKFLKLVAHETNAVNDGLYRYTPLSKWNLDARQGLQDDFQHWAWGQLAQQDETAPTAPISWRPAWRFEKIDNVRTLRYLRADPADSATCVNCHNRMEYTPEILSRRLTSETATGKQWHQFQLLGAIEADVPLDKIDNFAANQAHANLLFEMFIIAVGLLAAAALVCRDMRREQAATMHFEAQAKSLEEARAELQVKNLALAQANRIQEEQQSELTRFLAVASHDLRQPMHALNLYLGALLNVELSAAARPLLANVRQCAQIMDEMFLALLDLSRLDAQIVKPRIESFPMAALLERLAVEFTLSAQIKGLEFHIEPTVAWVESDVALVEQMLRNITANAVRYTTAGRVVIACSSRDGSLHVAVQDTGIGISPHQQATVFEEFCQLGAASRDRTQGLGLGLAIVRRLSRLLEAPVTLTSSQGQGSTFSIALPLAVRQSGVPAPAVALADGQGLHGKLIVVVDDEENILRAMQVLLEQWGCLVVAAKSASEAVEKLSGGANLPDALICDYRLRLKETGLDVIKTLREEFNEEIPALLISGDTGRICVQESEFSCMPVLHKPVQAEVLHDALVRILCGPSVSAQ
ncbi:ATP-binding protein [Collimonas humicola]|uniref:ATP-binding protein n=1 Tax=Collimonas humicola TaxID=2825886 RepID=UPI001B8B1456|nr:ATP-binding protein [Collimonas humicola]